MLVQNFAAAWAARTSFYMGAFDKRTDAFVAQIYIGTVGMDVPEFELGYFVDKDHEGQGYVTEAARATLRFMFEHLKAYRVRLQCDDTNTRSRRVAERCGMVREGHLRDNKRSSDGVRSGTLCFGLLKPEFEARGFGTS